MTPETAKLRRLLVRTLEAIDCVNAAKVDVYPLHWDSVEGLNAGQPPREEFARRRAIMEAVLKGGRVEGCYNGVWLEYLGRPFTPLWDEYDYRLMAEPEKAKPREPRKTMKLRQIVPGWWVEEDGYSFLGHAEISVEVLP